ncbi:putative nuclear export protein [Encephalitozoon hellem]|uniref:Nuclear export protein n=1 Tax=Encephalitozoon hellem TaxID=27973 RepID=A0ABY8CHT2_ENCHE|nr:putative nuclear export protein [Encephalitozoon hellem]
MNLAIYLGNALESTEKTLKVARLEKEVEDVCKAHRDLVFSQRHIDFQMKNREKKAQMELEICKVLRKLHEQILKQNLGYTKCISSKIQGTKGVGENERKDSSGNMEMMRYRDQIYTLLSYLHNNERMGARILSFQRALENNDRIRSAGNGVVCLINRIGLSILKETGKVIKAYGGSIDERKDMMLRYEDLRVKSLLEQLKQKTSNCEEIMREEAISRVLAVLSQGSVENDIRFAELIDETLERTESYEFPEITRMSVQFIIAKKYVEDMVSLKKQPFLRKYLERNTGSKK